MFCDLTLISFRVEDDDGGDDGASDGVPTDDNDDTSVFVIGAVLDGVDAKVDNASDDGDNESCEGNDAVVTDVVTEGNGNSTTVIGV